MAYFDCRDCARERVHVAERAGAAQSKANHMGSRPGRAVKPRSGMGGGATALADMLKNMDVGRSPNTHSSSFPDAEGTLSAAATASRGLHLTPAATRTQASSTSMRARSAAPVLPLGEQWVKTQGWRLGGPDPAAS